jgi:hypothetical protein
MTSDCLRVALFSVVLLIIQHKHFPSCEAAASSVPPAANIPQIRDEMLTPVQALEAAIICDALYDMNPSNKLQKTPPQYTVLSYDENTSNNIDVEQDFDVDTDTTATSDAYWVGNSAQRLVVALRGSSRFEDAMAYAEEQVQLGPKGRLFSSMMRFPNGTDDYALPVEIDVMVHEGFNRVFDAAYENITKIIDPLLQAGHYSSVSIIGHGLGGAKASLFATYYAFHHPTTAVYVQTFGQPRCGNFGFKILLESIPNLNVWRLVNQQDVVPRAPFSNYHHAGHLVWKQMPLTAATSDDRDNNEDIAIYPGFFRTVGDAALGYAGIEDISMAVCRNCMELGEQFLKYHDITTGFLPWLAKAVADPIKFFPTEFELTSNGETRLLTDGPPPDAAEEVR